MANFNIRVEEGGEREAMRMFLFEVYRWLYEILMDHPSLFVQYLVGPLRELHRINDSNLGRAANWVSEMPRTHLEDHDLLAPSLNIKILIVRFWHLQAMTDLTEFSSDQAGGATSIRPAQTTKRTLSSINSLLKSILSAAPGGGALVELKEAIENAINDLPGSPNSERPRVYPI